MTVGRLRLTLPEGYWAGDVSREHPEATLRVLAATTGGDTGAELVSIIASDLDPVVGSIADHETLSNADVIARSDREATVRFDIARPLVFRAAARAGLPIEPPVVLAEGEATLDVPGGRGRFSEFCRRLDAADIECDVESVGRGDRSERTLTDRQRELIDTAIDLGYYDTPRRCSLPELAEHVGIAKSTCCETLQRAESRLIKQWLDVEASEKVTASPV